MADFVSPWKMALALYFRPFLQLFFPHIHDDIDWSRSWESLDKELQQLAPRSARGKKSVDHLAKVWRKHGGEAWVLVHVDVQTQRERTFAERMAGYNFRIHDRHARDVASLAVLADDNPAWRPAGHVRELWGFSVRTVYPVVKLLDYRPREAELEASRNLFAPIVLAHLKALETRRDPENWRFWKVQLVRRLYERGLSKDKVRQLFDLIDWLMELPLPQDEVFWDQVEQLQEARKMPFINTPDRIGIRRGMLHTMEKVLRKHYGEDGLVLLPTLKGVYDTHKLDELTDAILQGVPLDLLRRQCEAAALPAPEATRKPRRPKTS